jgi:hypothetical protein
MLSPARKEVSHPYKIGKTTFMQYTSVIRVLNRRLEDRFQTEW